MSTVSEHALLTMNFQAMQSAYRRDPAPDYAQRVAVLKKLKQALITHEQQIYQALSIDYGYRSEFDTFFADIMPTIAAIKYAIKHLKRWMRPSKRHAGLMLAPSTVTVHYQPLGVVGVVTPWNFPFYLALGPTVQALAAGNRVMIKMSEFTPNANQILRTILDDISDHVHLVEGDAETGAAFTALPFDHLIFTGSTAVGKLVAKAAADNLTPVTLELGGKSPTIIDAHIDMKIAVDAVIMGKSINSGQICVAPDYVFVPTTRLDAFIETFIARYSEYHLKSANRNQQSHIISQRQHTRLVQLLEDAKAKGAKIHAVKAMGPDDNKCVYPHLLTNLTDDMAVLKEEIFGSLLPVMTYETLDDVVTYITDRPRPLALYIMSNNPTLIERLITHTHSGGIGINDTAMHVVADDAPFGGIGHSGMGHYHGYEGFLTFSKAKTVLYSSSWLPKNRFLLKHRDWALKVLRKWLLR
ncbi:coniferyl aldehyde dehydrogenase [Pseudoalteromonas sp. OOF1S-7]|uniref:coniferyl aldehyde dehydrogenase n=1 Tax=Pseudoalteromonas sp. OOF1S-7 TaxID=2917757 RepID=UPI001EF41638|nr:coniferyl aldehyde dehydrogenase [Pseudoalteromonas sp. OOF1S-7]MCG7534270.1 coniferyl aldehyde dehydrogenase [Pseudoalteromonas sp. OOF1S-7]